AAEPVIARGDGRRIDDVGAGGPGEGVAVVALRALEIARDAGRAAAVVAKEEVPVERAGAALIVPDRQLRPGVTPGPAADEDRSPGVAPGAGGHGPVVPRVIGVPDVALLPQRQVAGVDEDAAHVGLVAAPARVLGGVPEEADDLGPAAVEPAHPAGLHPVVG